MDAMNYATMNQHNAYPMWGANPYPGAPVMFNPAVPQPANISSLSDEEIKLISQKKPSKIDINISQEDYLRSMCNHNHNGHSVVQQKNDGSVRQVAEETFNGWCHDLFSKIMDRRINPHCFRMSRATNLVCEHGRPIETAQKLLGHESSETTQIYVIREDLEDADDAFI